jgi:translocation and assembly module TamB
LEQQVSSNLTLTYSTEVSQTSQQVIQGEYNVSRNISILAVRDQNGVVSFDVLLRHRRK